MDCPNCDKRPVKRFYGFRLNGVTFKKYIKGYFRCRHCGILLKQARSSEGFPSYEKGFWPRFILSFVLMFGVIMGIFVLLGESETGFWIAFPFYLIMLAGIVVWIEEIKARYWILKEVDDMEKDQKQQRRMGALGWTVLLVFIVLMLGGLVSLDLFGDTVAIADWQFIVGLILYVVFLVGGSLGIFHYFSESGESN